ncbi:MAG: hypothetical protein JWO94_3717 [Verrucomicrobiaceae bacterium]|nr:hypothetical protein [Verrucomicrobiaceae bacterium]
MASIRDTLAGVVQRSESAAAATALGQGAEAAAPHPGLAAKDPAKDEGAAQDQKLAEDHADMADRIRKAAQLRVQMARLEVERRHDQVVRLEERQTEIGQQNLPPAEKAADLGEANMRLNEARADLVRAQEAQLNTQHAATEKIKALDLPSVADTALGADKALAPEKKPSVRDQLKGFFSRGDKAAGPAVAVPKAKL